MHADDQDAPQPDGMIPADSAAAVAEADGLTPPQVDVPAAAGAAEPVGRSGLFWRFAIGLIVVDQVTKWFVRDAVPLFDTKTIIPGFLDFVHVRNEGVAFGLLNNI